MSLVLQPTIDLHLPESKIIAPFLRLGRTGPPRPMGLGTTSVVVVQEGHGMAGHPTQKSCTEAVWRVQKAARLVEQETRAVLQRSS